MITTLQRLHIMTAGVPLTMVSGVRWGSCHLRDRRCVHQTQHSDGIGEELRAHLAIGLFPARATLVVMPRVGGSVVAITFQSRTENGAALHNLRCLRVL